MADAVGVLKHRLQRPVIEIGIAGQHGIGEIGQGVKIGIVDGFDHLHEKNASSLTRSSFSRFTTTFFSGAILGHFAQALRCSLHIGR